MPHKAKVTMQMSNPNMDQIITYPYTPFIDIRGMLWIIQSIRNIPINATRR